MRTRFDNVQQVVGALNEAGVSYLVLRNYENLLDDSIYVGGHEDIDILCDKSSSVIDALGAISNRNKPDGTHYHIFVNGDRVNLDLRSVGDGYYCEKWQKEMLENCVLYKSFYVMNNSDYFFSLIHHAILQKTHFSDEYKDRLHIMANQLGIELTNYDKENFLACLQNYMKEHGYTFEYTKDPSIPLQYQLVESSLIVNDKSRKRARLFFLICTGTRKFIVDIAYKIYKSLFK